MLHLDQYLTVILFFGDKKGRKLQQKSISFKQKIYTIHYIQYNILSSFKKTHIISTQKHLRLKFYS